MKIFFFLYRTIPRSANSSKIKFFQVNHHFFEIKANANAEQNEAADKDESENTVDQNDDNANQKPKEYYKINTKENSGLPEKLFVAIECLLDDSNEKVRLAASITLFTVSRAKTSSSAKDKVRLDLSHTLTLTRHLLWFDSKAEGILRETLDSHHVADKYAAAQCLASHGIFDAKIAEILLKIYFESEDEVTREQTIKIIAELSRRTVSHWGKGFSIFCLKLESELQKPSISANDTEPETDFMTFLIRKTC